MEESALHAAQGCASQYRINASCSLQKAFEFQH